MSAYAQVVPGQGPAAPQAQTMAGAGNDHHPQGHGTAPPYEPPTGSWTAGLCDCFGQCWPSCICACLFPCFPLASLAGRTKVFSYGLLLGALLILWVANVVFIYIFYAKWASKAANGEYGDPETGVVDEDQVLEMQRDTTLIGLPHFIFLVLIFLTTLIVLVRVRNRYKLPSPCFGCVGMNCWSFFGDCLASVVCNMCVVTQMATHVFGYKKCCDCDKGAFCSSNV